MRKILIKIIELYQRFLSPDTGYTRVFFKGGYCKFTPNCSEYCKQAIQKKGIIIGIAKGIWRIIRCNPWSKGGYDPLK